MITKQYAWEFDPYASNALNFIKGERHVLQPDSGNGFHFFIPKAAPFFLKDIKVVHVQTGKVLDEGIDWQPGWAFELATRRTLMPVYGAISVLDKTLNGTFEIQYRTLGGEYTLDQATLLEYLMNVAYDPRVTTWESIVDKPLYFNPLEHAFNAEDLVGMDETISALDRIRDAILQAAERIYPSLAVHLKDHDNPHNTTKEQVGLGSVQNFPMATDAEAAAGTARNRYMSPATTAAMIAAISSESVAGHVSNRNNPHGVTKTQVGLGNVDNFASATVAQAEAGTANNLFLTVAAGAAMIRKLAIADVSLHINDKANPHETTKTHVGLGNVENLPIADMATYDTGTSDRHYAVVSGVKRMIDRFAVTPLNNHINDKDNPHSTTKTHVGLGNVANYLVADNTALDAGTATDRYVVVSGVKRMIDRFAVTALNNHINDKANPHETTKTHVGLGNVENFEIASVADVDAGTATDKYTVVSTVRQMIDRFAITQLSTHIGDRTNPHRVTKTQLGLGFVENYAPATVSAAIEATSGDLYLTPEGLGAFFKEKFPSIGAGTMLTRLKLPIPSVGGTAWLKLVEHQNNEGSVGHYLVYGVTDNENYIQLHTTPDGLIVEDYTGSLLRGAFCYVLNAANNTCDIYYRREGQTIDVSIVKAGAGGTLVENRSSDWIVTQPPGAVYPKVTSRFIEQQLVDMWQDYDLAYGLNEASDLISGKTSKVLSTISLTTKIVDESDEDFHIYTWTGPFTVASGKTVRLAIGEFGVYGGNVRVTVDGTIVGDDTIVTPTVVYDNFPLAVGTRTVKLSLRCPKTLRAPNFIKGFVRTEELV